MPPKRRNPPKAKAPTMDLTPYSVPVTPPLAPPQVAMNPKRELAVDYDQVTIQSAYTVTLDNLRAAINAQVGSANTPNVILRYVHVWGKQGPTNVSSVELIDAEFGTRVTGDSTVTDRARAGYRFPKNVQPFYSVNAPGIQGICTVNTSDVTTELTFRFGVTYWT